MLGIGLVASTLLQCGQREHAPSFVLAPSAQGGSGGTSDGGLRIVEAGLDANLCGDQEIPAITDPPNLYFVVDRSGSMGDPLPGSAYSKYENARIAISVMLRAVGHRVKYGASVFPAFANPDGCAVGMQVFPTEAGDPPTYAASGKNGPVLQDLLDRLGSTVPSGGTPTAATLKALESTIFGLAGKKTYVVLMTDGAPNCNSALTCDLDQCIPNIEHDSIGTTSCEAPLNCCDPRQVGEAGIGYCVDADATAAAVADYESAGIDTYVVGMPGSEQYSALLSRLAVAGHTARAGTTPYYAVSDTNELSDALKAIGAHVAITCDLPLAAAPANAGYVNVYFDGQAVPFDASDGWQWTNDEDSIQFVGAACDTLSSGNVLNVQVLEGCKTVVR
ncbi:MAG TPA: vWA domain-containing protein [Polyangiaceae bacterium]|nr:vWA domain-containing protein [Polyangiaceae bacterium]